MQQNYSPKTSFHQKWNFYFEKFDHSPKFVNFSQITEKINLSHKRPLLIILHSGIVLFNPCTEIIVWGFRT